MLYPVKDFILGGITLPLKIAVCGDEIFPLRSVITLAKRMVGQSNVCTTTSPDTFLKALQTPQRLIVYEAKELPIPEEEIEAYDGSFILIVPYHIAYRLKHIKAIRSSFLYDQDVNLYAKDFVRAFKLTTLDAETIKSIKHRTSNSVVDLRNAMNLVSLYGADNINDAWLSQVLNGIPVMNLTVIWRNFVKGYTRVLVNTLQEDKIKTILAMIKTNVITSLRAEGCFAANIPITDIEIIMDKHPYVIQKAKEDYDKLGGDDKLHELLGLVTKWITSLECGEKTNKQVMTELLLWRELNKQM